MSDSNATKPLVYAAIQSLLEDPSLPITDDTALIGDGNLLDSMKMVELCILLEDKASELGFEFDWTSDTAMSKSRSMFRSAGALASEFVAQMTAKK